MANHIASVVASPTNSAKNLEIADRIETKGCVKLAWRNGAGRKVMSTIAEWLTSLGLSEYAPRFAENDIDISVLRHLTDQDLKELGVSLPVRRVFPSTAAE